MSETDPVGMSLRMTAAMDFVRNGSDEDMRQHFRWQAEQILGSLALDDLTTAELVSLVTVLIPAHSRALGPQDVEHGPVLRLIRPDAG